MFSSPLKSKFPHLISSRSRPIASLSAGNAAERASADDRGNLRVRLRLYAMAEWSVDAPSNALNHRNSFDLNGQKEKERDNERQLNGSFFTYDREYMVKMISESLHIVHKTVVALEISLLNQRIPSY